MNQFLSLSKGLSRNPVFHIYEASIIFSKRESICSVVNIKTFHFCARRLCEKKDDTVSSNQDGTSLNQDAIKTEQLQQAHEAVALKSTEEGATPHQANVKPAGKHITSKQKTAKSGKEKLLSLLGSMKVEVTTKTKHKPLAEVGITSKYGQPKMENTISMFKRAKNEASSEGETQETLSPDLVSAASAAAATLPNRGQAESDLLRQLRQRKALTEAQKKEEVDNIKALITDMRVRKKQNQQAMSFTNQIQFDEDGRGYTFDSDGFKRKNLFPSTKLDIFSPATDDQRVDSAITKPTLWDIDFAEQLSQKINLTPHNGFAEMIQWTKEGKLWQYPIDNEIGLEEEASVPFHEHVFLEKYLEDGFPRQGPVRHFMELVVVGLSKNPYLTVQQKKEHILWFKDYFHEKEDILNEAEVYLQ